MSEKKFQAFERNIQYCQFTFKVEQIIAFYPFGLK